MTGRSRQRGIALLVALLTVALAAILIAGLLDRGELALARTRNALREEQAEAYAQGLELYAAEVLVKDYAQDPSSDSNSDIWAAGIPPQTVAGGTIIASMQDLDGCFNLNNLASADASSWLPVFRRLLAVQHVDAAVADAVEAWLGRVGTADVTDAVYLAQPVPYRSAQRRFAHVSELRLVQGVDGDVYARLAPYVCALPPGTQLNVNTASVPMLQALGAGITEAQARTLWQNGQARWSNVDDFASQPNVAIQTPKGLLSTISTYFLARGDVVLDGVPFTFFSLIERNPGIHVVERSRGSDAALAVAAGSPATTVDGDPASDQQGSPSP